MKKIKKLLKFIPVISIAFVCGLVGLFSSYHNISSSYASSSQTLYTNQYSTSYSLTYNNVITDYNVLPNSFYYTYTVSTTGSDYSVSFAFQMTGLTHTRYSGAQGWTLNFSPSTTLNYSKNGLSSNLTYFEYRIKSLTVQPSFADTTRQRIPCSLYLDYRFSTNETYSNVTPINCYIALNLPVSSSVFTDFVSSFSSSTYSAPVVLFALTYIPSSVQEAYNAGFADGYNGGFTDGYSKGNADGYNNGYDIGYISGVESQEQAIQDAFTEGYNAGYDEGFNTDSTVGAIFSGILQVGMLPVNVLLAIFNFEILGINLSAFISAILTVCLTVIVIRTIKGGNE